MNKIVEIEDGLFVNVKHSKDISRHKDGVWVLGLNGRNADNTYMACILPNRDAQTIVKIIEKYIEQQNTTTTTTN
jgi:hypothetical protein